MGKIRNAYKIFVVMPHVRGLDGRFRQTLDCNVKIYLGGSRSCTGFTSLRIRFHAEFLWPDTVMNVE
jgi:hypothetical protein